jgi:hypothetical protein
VLAIVFAVAALYLRRARYLNAAVGAWLFVSALLMSTLGEATLWNNAVVGLAVLIAAFLGEGVGAIQREREMYGRI